MIKSISDPAMSLPQLNITPRADNGGEKIQEEEHSNKPDFTEKESQMLTLQDFDIMAAVGFGGFGRTFFVEHIETKKIYALKAMDKMNKFRSNIAKLGRNEMAIHKELSSPFIIQYHASFETPRWIGLVMELACKENLMEFSTRHWNTMNAKVKKFFLAEILLAIKYLHEKDIAHRDIKNENVLLSATGHAKLADFGFAIEGMTADKTIKSSLGTPACTAPEVFNGIGYTRACDIWSYGIAVFELMTLTSAIVEKDERKIRRMICGIKDCNVDFPVRKWNEDGNGYDLVRKCLQFEDERLTIEEIQAHPFFKDTKWSRLHEKFHRDTSKFEIMKREDFPGPIFPKNCDCLLAKCICEENQGELQNDEIINGDTE